MKKIKNLIGAFVLVLIVVISGCGNSISGDKNLKIGVIAPLTGEAASYGLAAKEGLDFAVKEINLKGGILGKNIELIYEDSQLDIKQANSIISKFVNLDKLAIVIIADGSGPTTAIAPVADLTKTLFLATLASTPKLSTIGDYVFRTVPSDSYQGVELAKFADRKGFKTASIIYVNDAYGVGIKEVFAKTFSGKIVSTESFENNDIDFKAQLTKIKNKNPDAILIVARNELPNLLKQIKDFKIKSTLFGSETSKDEKLIETAGSSAEGMYSIFFSTPEDYKNYRVNFKKEYGREPAAYSDYSYDAVYILTEAIKSIKSFDATEIKDQLYKTKIYGASGIVEFNQDGDVINKPFTFYQVVNGKFVPVPQ